MTPTRRLGWTALALLALAGCEAATPTTEPATPSTSAPSSPTPAPSPEAPKDKEEVKSLPVEPSKEEAPKGAAAAKLSDEEVAEIKKLPAEDQALALAQVTCPVSDEHLGEMGAPIKKVVEGKTVFLCCKSCEKELDAEPAKYLAKLKK